MKIDHWPLPELHLVILAASAFFIKLRARGQSFTWQGPHI
jgi:hypothetical protein